jgi:AAA domain
MTNAGYIPSGKPPIDLYGAGPPKAANGVHESDGTPHSKYKAEQKAAELGPTATDPLRGLEHLAKVAVLGRERIRELAVAPPRFVWDPIAVAGTIVLLAAGPGEGKTTLLFLILAARLNMGEPVFVLGRRVQPAPAGTWLVLIEGEHAESSAARKLLRSMALLGVDDRALDRVILVARKAVRLGSPEWGDIVKLVAAGVVSDIAIDTVARVAPSDSDSEREQTAIFDQVAQAIDAAPSDETKPMVWACAHTRKNGRTGDVSDVAGSVQRTGQADSVLMLAGEKVEGRTVATKVTFAKLREEPDEYPLPVTFSITADAVRMNATRDGDERPLEVRITEQLHLGPKTKNALASTLGRAWGDLDPAISNLFSERRITATTVTVRGRQHKAFALRNDTRRTPDEGFQPSAPDEDPTDS